MNRQNGNPSLVRGLSLIGAISVNAGNMVGTGIFLKARIMTCNVGTPSLVMLVWVAGGLLTLAGALTYAELATMMPEAGGEYVFLKRAWGRPMGFLYGWTIFFVARTGSQAALAVGSAIFINILTGGALDRPFFVFHPFGHDIPFGWLQVVALGTIATVTAVNCLTVAASGRIASLLTGIKFGLLAAIGVGAFALAHGNWAHFSMSGAAGTCDAVAAGARGGIAGFGAAMLGALWAYDGWNNITPLSGEVRNPQRNLPLAFIGGMLIVAGLYIFVNVAYFYVLTPGEVASVALSSSVATETVRRFLGASATAFVAASLLSSSLGAMHSSMLANARVPFAMARDGLFFRRLASVAPHIRIPRNALIAQGCWAGVLALSGSYDVLTDYVIFASWLLYGLTAASVFVFRRKLPDAPRPYRTWGYPVVPAIFLLVTAWLLLNTLRTGPVQAFTGLALMVLGLPFYLFWARRGKPVDSEVSY
ncbi:MAG TPA: amino acid permease [Bryobacteraceae bacterium]|nr:amino acid permease [Bryobacteraceae bacterium]